MVLVSVVGEFLTLFTEIMVVVSVVGEVVSVVGEFRFGSPFFEKNAEFGKKIKKIMKISIFSKKSKKSSHQQRPAGLLPSFACSFC